MHSRTCRQHIRSITLLMEIQSPKNQGIYVGSPGTASSHQIVWVFWSHFGGAFKKTDFFGTNTEPTTLRYTNYRYRTWDCGLMLNRLGDFSSCEMMVAPHQGTEGSGIPCLWFPAPKAATVILFFHANADAWCFVGCFLVEVWTLWIWDDEIWWICTELTFGPTT